MYDRGMAITYCRPVKLHHARTTATGRSQRSQTTSLPCEHFGRVRRIDKLIIRGHDCVWHCLRDLRVNDHESCTFTSDRTPSPESGPHRHRDGGDTPCDRFPEKISSVLKALETSFAGVPTPRMLRSHLSIRVVLTPHSNYLTVKQGRAGAPAHVRS